MKILAVVGSYRKGKTIDSLVDRAIEGARAGGAGEVEVEKVYLVDRHIEYCRNCMVCRREDGGKSRADCVIDDDMGEICRMVEEADGFIFGTPVNMGAVTAVMKTFLERTCWVFAKPGKRPIDGCPRPRSSRGKRAVIIVSSGLIPPLLRRWCDDATSLIKSYCGDSLNAKVVGSLYAGAVEKRGVEGYFDRAYELGRELTG